MRILFLMLGVIALGFSIYCFANSFSGNVILGIIGIILFLLGTAKAVID